ncbi:MAG: carboxylesterase family protein, partial [Crocinitomicaceae bacterium]|nr:carboxylesterase family protein [Crocinitomicaceae bacterium]
MTMNSDNRTTVRKTLLFICELFFSVYSIGQSPQCLSGRYADTALFDSTEIVVSQNIVYGHATHFLGGQDNELQLDAWYPDTSVDPIDLRPLIVLTHGGAFAAGNRSAMNFQCMEYARRGFVAVTISYRLGWNCDPNSGILLCGLCGPLQNNFRMAVYSAVQDHRAALRYLVDHQVEYGIDTNWIYAGGESAGSITSLASAFWDQQEADAFVPSASALLGGLNESGNNLTATYSIKGIVNNCGAVFNINDIDTSEDIPVISFHDQNDCVVPYANGSVLNCFNCTSFPAASGSSAIYNKQSSLDICTELNTVQLSLGHCTWPALYVVKRASCFIKRIQCGVCTNSTNFNIYASSPCAGLGVVVPPVSGCTYSNAVNYSPGATEDDGSCIFSGDNCPADLNYDHVVGVEDLILFIGAYGDT